MPGFVRVSDGILLGHAGQSESEGGGGGGDGGDKERGTHSNPVSLVELVRVLLQHPSEGGLCLL